MLEKGAVVILQSNLQEANSVAKQVEGAFSVRLATDDWMQALAVIERERVDFLITELMLKQTDGLYVIKAVKKKRPSVHCIVVSIIDNSDLIRECINSGACNYVIKPVSYSTLISRMTDLLQSRSQNSGEKKSRAIDERISRIFIGMGIPPHIKGYVYLREGVKLAVQNPELINSVTKKLYPMIGEKFSTSASKVERAIRHAIEVAWNKGRIEAFNALFGVKAYGENEKPTNSEFIALIADRILLDELSNPDVRDVNDKR